MKKLLSEIEQVVNNEYTRAAQKFGECHASNHEAYAVIKEEYEEAVEAGAPFESFMLSLWEKVRNNDEHGASCGYVDMLAVAKHAAAEWVQVAAMCEKALHIKEESDK